MCPQWSAVVETSPHSGKNNHHYQSPFKFTSYSKSPVRCSPHYSKPRHICGEGRNGSQILYPKYIYNLSVADTGGLQWFQLKAPLKNSRSATACIWCADYKYR